MATVLIVDDSRPLQQHVAKTLLDAQIADRVLTADTGGQALALLNKERVDLVLCDLVMPGLDGFKVLSVMRERDEAVPVPVILLTARGEISEKVRCLEAGGSDYLTKPFNDQELVARCRVHLQLKMRSEQLQRLASTDYLTGVANRLQLKADLARELNRALRSKAPLGFFICDLDHFKKVNDSCGHQAGDELLVAVAQALKHELRACDMVARYGGEEFAAILPDADREGTLIAAERCRRRIESITLPRVKRSIRISASFGAISVRKAAACSDDMIVGAADAALYRAKAEGRNCVVMADDISPAGPSMIGQLSHGDEGVQATSAGK